LQVAIAARRAVVPSLVAGAALGAVHAGPAAAGLPAVRRLAPRLAGRGRPDHVALTFDDGPDPCSTPWFLEALEGLGWKATFFMLGSMVRRAPGLAAEVAAAGHEVALHGDLHRSHVARSPGAVGVDLTRGLTTVAEATGVAPRFYRPPYGLLSAGTLLASRNLGLRPVLWTTWGRDWTDQATPASVAAEVRATLAPGATVLLHDSDCTSAPTCWRSALGALGRLAEECEESGWAVGPLAEHGL
jgi:peptidoglycan/xylan/chitin deacetylase (PgdA/CDA1 family)